MLTLLKNIECNAPEYIGRKDILIAGDKICKITDAGRLAKFEFADYTADCGGLMAFPGLIDQHVHIMGGGGEGGFISRAPEIERNDILKAGVTTVVGLLGADGSTRSLEGLYAKAKALSGQGITAFMYSGSYAVPPVTLTGSITKDLVFIDIVIGAGEIAVSDHRSSQPSVETLLKLAADTHLGGMLGGKAGVLHLHIGEGKDGLDPLIRLREQSDLPSEMFVPTHTNRSAALFEQAIRYCLDTGGHIDMTAGETAGIAVPEAVIMLKGAGADLSRVTVSSDSNGSIPGGGVAKIQVIYDDIIGCIRAGVSPAEAFSLSTVNVSKILKLYPQKGVIDEGADADIVIVDKNYHVQMLLGRGRLLIENGNIKE